MTKNKYNIGITGGRRALVNSTFLRSNRHIEFPIGNLLKITNTPIEFIKNLDPVINSISELSELLLYEDKLDIWDKPLFLISSKGLKILYKISLKNLKDECISYEESLFVERLFGRDNSLRKEDWNNISKLCKTLILAGRDNIWSDKIHNSYLCNVKFYINYECGGNTETGISEVLNYIKDYEKGLITDVGFYSLIIYRFNNYNVNNIIPIEILSDLNVYIEKYMKWENVLTTYDKYRVMKEICENKIKLYK